MDCCCISDGSLLKLSGRMISFAALSSAHISCPVLSLRALAFVLSTSAGATAHLKRVAPPPASRPINVFQSLVEMCHSGALFLSCTV